MSDLRPTVYNSIDSFGLPTYEVRGDSIYPTVHNKRDSYGLPVYEIRGSQIYPTVHNSMHSSGCQYSRFEVGRFTQPCTTKPTPLDCPLSMSRRVLAPNE